MTKLPGQLTGTYYVRAIRPAFQDVQRLLPLMRDRAELRRQALKLRFWGQDDFGPHVVDLDWEWIKAARAKNIGELRIDDVLGGCNNLRVITWHPPTPIPPSWCVDFGPVPHIWILAVMQKKRDNFTSANLTTFDLRRQTVLSRFYHQL